MMLEKSISISIISHGQMNLVEQLLKDLQQYCENNIEVILTVNIPEEVPATFSDFSYPIHYIRNNMPKGFGANHNAAFKLATHSYFCILNPDIRLTSHAFDILTNYLEDKTIGAVAPAVFDHEGIRQDNARKFPTLISLIKSVLLNNRRQDYDILQEYIFPDWIAGMFMLFRSEVYKEIQGFDERYFLYCEDIDICARLRKRHYRVMLANQVSVIHDARRDSHKKLKYLWWHTKSMLIYFYHNYI